jgi:hypothetical protein
MEDHIDVIEDHLPDVIGDQMAVELGFQWPHHTHFLAAHKAQHPACEILLSGFDQRFQDIIILTRHTRTTPGYRFLISV